MSLLVRLLRDLRPHHRAGAGVLACTLLYAGARLAPPLLARVLLDATVRGRPAHLLGMSLSASQTVLAVPMAMLAVAGALAASQYLMRVWGGLLGQQVVGDFQVRLLEHLLRLPAPTLERRPLGRQMVRFGSDMTAIRRLTSRSLPEFLRDSVAVIAIGATLIAVHWPLALPIVAALAADLVAVTLAWHRLRSANRVVRAERSRVAAMAYDRLAVASTVKLVGGERREASRLHRAQSRVLDATRRAAEMSGRLSAASEIVVGVSVAISLGLGAQQVLARVISAGEMVAFYSLTLLLVSPLRSLARTVESLAPGAVALDRLYATFDRAAERDHHGAQQLRVRNGVITLSNIRVTGIAIPDLRIEPGLTAIVGGASSGLSLLGPLLVRLRDPEAGTITIDGVPLARATLRSLRRAVAYLPFPPVLLKGSLRHNLRAGLHGLSDDTLWQALQSAEAAWAETLDLSVGSGGRRLTMLQRWQVLCARILLARPAVVVIDVQPLDARLLDPILRAMRAAGIRTIVVLSARASDVPADRVISLDEVAASVYA